MLQGELSAILSTFTKLPFVVKIFVLSISECPFYTGFNVLRFTQILLYPVLHRLYCTLFLVSVSLLSASGSLIIIQEHHLHQWLPSPDS